MTEQMAIQQLNFDMEMIRFDPNTGETLTLEQIKARNEENYKTYIADEIAITALLEIQQYRAIGTVEEIQTAMKYMRIAKMHGTVGKVIDACAEYESIGTVEELQALKEIDNDCTIRHLTGECSYNETGCSGCIGREKIKVALEKSVAKKPLYVPTEYSMARQEYRCPSCNGYLSESVKRKHCADCGQHLDWE